MDRIDDIELHELEQIERNLNTDVTAESDVTPGSDTASQSGFMVFSPSGFMVFSASGFMVF